MERLLNPFRGFAATTVLAVVAAFVISAWFVASSLLIEDSAGVAASQSTFSLLATKKGDSSRASQAALTEVARDNHVNIALVRPDVLRGQKHWKLFTFIGNADDHSLERKAFDPSVSTVVHPAADLNREDLRADYVTTAHGSALTTLADDLRTRGFEVSTAELPPFAAILFVADDAGRQAILAVVFLGGVATIAAEAIRRRRRQAVRRLTGWSRREALLREGREVSALVGATALGTFLATLGFLGAYNRFASLDRFVVDLVPVYLLTAVVIVTLHGLFSGWPRPGSLSAVFAGAAPSLPRRVLPHVVRVAAILVTVTQIAGLSSSLALNERLEQRLALQAPVKNWVQMRGNLASVVDKTFDDRFGEVVRGEVRAGQALLVAHDFGGTDDDPYGPFGYSRLTVNRKYLDLTPLEDPRGRRLSLPPSSKGTVDLLVPESLAQHKSELAAEYTKFFDPPEAGLVIPEIRVHLIADDQLTPDLGDEDDPAVPVRVGNVLLVLPDDDNSQPDWFYSVSAGNGQVLFSDPHAVLDTAERNDTDNGIHTLAPFGETIDRQLADLRDENARLASAVVLGLIVLMGTTGATIAAFAIRCRTARRVRALVGRSPWSTYVGFAGGALALTLAATGIAYGMVDAESSAAVEAASICVAADGAIISAGLFVLARSDARALHSRRPHPAARRKERKA